MKTPTIKQRNALFHHVSNDNEGFAEADRRRSSGLLFSLLMSAVLFGLIAFGILIAITIGRLM